MRIHTHNIYIYTYTYVSMYRCIYYINKYVHIYIYTYTHTYIYTHNTVDAWVNVSMIPMVKISQAALGTLVDARLANAWGTRLRKRHQGQSVRGDVCVYLMHGRIGDMYIYIHMYIYICMNTHTHTVSLSL